MQVLASMVNELTRAIPIQQPVVYLDYPMYGNIGDLLINLGTESFLCQNAYDVVARLSIFDLSHTDMTSFPVVRLKAHLPILDCAARRDATFVFQGGGNFGDLYQNHQHLREAIFERYPHVRTVVLPQTIFYERESEAARAAALIAKHRRLTIFSRDARSQEVASRLLGCPTTPMPDMAHHLWGHFSVPMGDTVVTLLRRDKETRHGGRSADALTGAFDWDDLMTSADRILLYAVAKLQTLGHGATQARVLNHVWYRLRDAMVARALALFASAHTICTDRLHGMIFAALLDRNVIVRDNSYGKVRSYYDLWLVPSDRICCEFESEFRAQPAAHV
jgi:pyruvyl transferase EpsO